MACISSVLKEEIWTLYHQNSEGPRMPVNQQFSITDTHCKLIKTFPRTKKNSQLIYLPYS